MKEFNRSAGVEIKKKKEIMKLFKTECLIRLRDLTFFFFISLLFMDVNHIKLQYEKKNSFK